MSLVSVGTQALHPLAMRDVFGECLVDGRLFRPMAADAQRLVQQLLVNAEIRRHAMSRRLCAPNVG